MNGRLPPLCLAPRSAGRPRLAPAWRLGLAACLALGGCDGRQPEAVAVPHYSLKVADAAMASGAPDMAARVTAIILEHDPDNVPAMVAAGDAYYAMGLFTRAGAAYRAAIARDPRAAPAHVGLGRTLVRSDPRAAEAAFNEALAIDPRNVGALNNLGITRDLMGRRAEAQAAYRQALAIAPGMDDVTINLGLSLALSGQREEASRLLRPLAAQPDAAPRWRKDIAAALAMAGDTAGARGVFGTPAPLLPPPAAQPPWPVVAAAPEAQALPVAVQSAPRIAVQRVALDPLPPAEAGAARPDAPPDTLPDTSPDTLPDTGATAVPRKPPRHARAAGGPGGFQVQLASLDDEARAQASWRRVALRSPDAARGHAPVIEPAEVNGRTYWRLRVGGFATRAAATAFCTRLRGAGQGCWVV